MMETNEIPSDRAETFISDFMALLWSSSRVTGASVFDVKVDVLWGGPEPVVLRIPDSHLGG